MFDVPQNHPFCRTKTFSLLNGTELMRGANPEGFLVPNTIPDTKSILGLGHKKQNEYKQKSIEDSQLRAVSFLFGRHYLIQDYLGLKGKEVGRELQLEEIEKIVEANYTKEEDKLAFWSALRLSSHYINFINVKNVSKVRAVNVRVLFDNSSRYALQPVTITGLRFGKFSYDPKWSIVSISELAPGDQVVFLATALSAVTSRDVEIRIDSFGEIDKMKLGLWLVFSLGILLIICWLDLIIKFISNFWKKLILVFKSKV